jgi:hypothetical protein
MTNPASCNDCAAIARELDDAYAEAWTSGDRAFRDAAVATYKLIGGTEEDAARAEALVPAAGLRGPALRINRVLQTKLIHEARSGHKMTWPAEPSSD